MAESSITHNFILTDPDEVEMFFKALEESANEPPKPSTVNVKFLDDPDEIRECMEKLDRAIEARTEGKEE